MIIIILQVLQLKQVLFKQTSVSRNSNYLPRNKLSAGFESIFRSSLHFSAFFLFCDAFTAASSYAGASRSSKDIAPVGHAGKQSPNPSQKFSLVLS